MFGSIYLKPSQTATDAPSAIGNRNPIVDSYVWCNGNTENNLSVGYNVTYAVTALMFSAKALFEIITPFEFDVVPDVKINTLNSSGSISILLKLSSPDSTTFLPNSTNVFKPTSCPSKGLSEFISTKYSTVGTFFLTFLIESSFLVE